jgi:hypothetical protein
MQCDPSVIPWFVTKKQKGKQGKRGNGEKEKRLY